MREILFRGKRINNSEWVEGSLLKANIGGKIAYLIFGNMFSLVGNEVKSLKHALVDPKTIGQYTGLTDKNGKRIFEGDIVYDKYSNKAYVSMEKGCWVLMYKENWDFLETNVSTCRVIGNIHDNSELLKGENK